MKEAVANLTQLLLIAADSDSMIWVVAAFLLHLDKI